MNQLTEQDIYNIRLDLALALMDVWDSENQQEILEILRNFCAISINNYLNQ